MQLSARMSVRIHVSEMYREAAACLHQLMKVSVFINLMSFFFIFGVSGLVSF